MTASPAASSAGVGDPGRRRGRGCDPASRRSRPRGRRARRRAPRRPLARRERRARRGSRARSAAAGPNGTSSCSREARVALADHALGIADERQIERAGEHARVRAARPAARRCPPRWSLSGCVMSTVSSRRAEPRDERQRARRAGDAGQARVDDAAPPRRRRSRPGARCAGRRPARSSRCPSASSRIMRPPRARRAGRRRRRRDRSPRPATCSRRGRPRRARSARSNVSSAANGKAIGVIARALDEQLLEALGEGAARRRPRCARRRPPRAAAISPNAPGPQIAMRLALICCPSSSAPTATGRAAQDVVDAGREQVAVEQPGRRRQLELAGRALARAAQVRARAPPSRARARWRRRRMRARAPCRARRARPGRRAPRRSSSAGSRKTASSVTPGRDVEREPLRRSRPPSAHVVRDDAAHAGGSDARGDERRQIGAATARGRAAAARPGRARCRRSRRSCRRSPAATRPAGARARARASGRAAASARAMSWVTA